MVLDWGALRGAALLWFTAFVAALLASRDGWLLWWGGLAESICWLVVLSLLVSLGPIRDFMVGLPRAHGRFVAGAVLLLLWGQFMGLRPERTFPVVSWRMFGSKIRRVEPITFVEVVGDTSDGRQVPLNPSRLFPALKNHRITVGLTTLVDQRLAQAADPGRRLSELLAGIGRAHNAANPATPILSVGVVRGRFDPDAAVPGARVTRERLWTVKIDPRSERP